MKAIIRFTVEGKTLDELEAAATERYRIIMDDPAAVPPFSSTLDVKPALNFDEASIPSESATQWSASFTANLVTDHGA